MLRADNGTENEAASVTGAEEKAADTEAASRAPKAVKEKSRVVKFLEFLLFGNAVRLKNKSLYIAYIAVLSGLSIALNSLSINLGAMKLTLLYVPLFIAGIYFGPLVPCAMALVASLVGGLVRGEFPPWALNIVGRCIMGIAMWFSVQVISKKVPLNLRIIIGAVITLFTVTYGTSILAYMYEPVYNPFYGMSYWTIFVARATQPLVLIVNTIITITLVNALDGVYYRRRASETKARENISPSTV